MKQRHWNQKVDLPGKRPPLFVPWRRRLMGLLLAAMAVMGAMAGMAIWIQPPPEPYSLPIWVAEYRTNALPTNIAGIRDRQAIRAASGVAPLGAQTLSSQQRYSLMEQLASLIERSPNDDVIVYVCAYAALGPQGICILPADADLDDPQTWLPLRTVLTNLARCPAQRKLIVLDICWPIASPRQGLISTDLASAIPAELAAVEDSKRLVLTCCSAGQVALVSPVLKQSVFGYYLVQGVQGAADGYNAGGIRDGRVSVREIASFVAARVDRWAFQNLGTRQTPQLLGTGADFPITSVPVQRASQQVLRAPFFHYPQWMADGWQWRDELAAGRGWRDMPHLMAQLEATLVRAENAWCQGGDASALEMQVRNQLQLLFQQQAAITRTIPMATPRSLALARALGAPVKPALRQPVETLVTHVRSQTMGLPKAEAQATRNKLLATFQSQVQDQPLFSVAYAVFDFAAETPNPDSELLMLLDDAMRLLHGGAPEYVEMALLHRLADMARQAAPGSWPTATVQLALQAMRMNEQLGCHARSLPWLQSRARVVHSLVHDGLTYFWSEGFASQDLAAERFRQALEEGRELLAYQSMLEQAYALSDQAFAQLPGCLPLMAANPQQFATWREAAQAATRLASLLESPPHGEVESEIGTSEWSKSSAAPGADAPSQLADSDAVQVAGSASSPGGAATTGAASMLKSARGSDPIAAAAWLDHLGQIRQVSDQLRKSLGELQQNWSEDRAARLIASCRGEDAGPSLAAEAQSLLATPLLSAAQRGELWEAWYQLATRLNGVTALADRADDLRQRHTTVLEPYDQVEFRAAQEALTWLRARSAVELLEMGGVDREPMVVLSGLLDERKPESLGEVSNWLRRAWLVELPALLGQQEALAKRARMARVIPPWSMPSELDNAETNPVAQLTAQRFRNLWGVLGNRYRYISRDGSGVPYYADIASQYLAVAGPVPDRYVQLNIEFPPVDLSSGSTAHAVIGWQVIGMGGRDDPRRGGANGQPVDVRFIQPDGQPLRLSLARTGGTSRGNPSRDSMPDGSSKDAGASDLAVAAQAASASPAAGDSQEPILTHPDPNVEVLVELPLPQPLVVDVSLSPEASPAAVAAAKGFLVEVLLDGRRYHKQVPLPKTVLPPVEILLSDNPKAPWPALDALRLRPLGKPQPYFIYLQSREQKPRQVNVTLNGTATTKVVLPPGQTVIAKFVGEPPKPGTPLPPLAGPIQVAVSDAQTGELLAQKAIGVAVAHPREYVRVQSADYVASGPGRNRFSLSMVAIGGPLKPPVTAEIELPKVVNPGLLGVQGGMFRGVVPGDGAALQLSAENIMFLEGSLEQGEVYLNVDGVPRVYIFDVTFGDGRIASMPVERQRPGLRLINQPAYQPGPNTTFGLQVDVPQSGSHVHVMLGRTEGNRFIPELQQELRAPLEETIGCSPFGPDGAILISAALSDWNLQMDTSGIVGPRTLTAKMIGYDGTPLGTVTSQVVFDDSPPQNLRVIPPTFPATSGQPYPVKALCTSSLSGVVSAQYFVGRPVDGKIPEKTPTVSGTPIDDHKLQWYAELPIPEDAKGTIAISAQFTNQVGLSAVATVMVDVQSADQAGLGTITGKVAEGPLPQAGLTVTLSDDKGAALKQANSGPDGSFTFPGLKPGKYTVSAYKESSNRRGSAEAIVAAGKTATANVSLLLNGK